MKKSVFLVKYWRHKPVFQNRYSKEAWSIQFCWHHQNCNHVDQNNLWKRNESQKDHRLFQYVSLFPNIRKIPHFWWKLLLSAELKGCLTWFIYFLDLQVQSCKLKNHWWMIAYVFQKYPKNFAFYFLTVSIVFSVYKQNFPVQ